MTPKEFAEIYAGLPPIFRRQHSPKKSVIVRMVEEFERHGLIVSPSGTSAEVIMKWLHRNGRCFSLLYHANFDTYVLMEVSREDIEETAAKPRKGET